MRRPEKNPPFILLVLSIVSILFFSQILSADSRIKILNIFRTPLKLISGTFYLLKDVSNFQEIRKENELLRENLQNLHRELLNAKEIHLENQRLRELLGFSMPEEHKIIPCMVIARDHLGLKDTIIIDKGKNHKVEKDMVVISGNGLVGRTREVGWSIARVLLITDRDSVVSGVVQRTRDEGAIIGNASAGLIMKYLEIGSDIEEGDEIITSGFGGVFEKGILIGEVRSVEEDASGLYLNAIIKPEVDMRELEEVLVIR